MEFYFIHPRLVRDGGANSNRYSEFFFVPSTGLANMLRARARIADNFRRNSYACGNLALLAHYRLVPRAAARPDRLSVGPCSQYVHIVWEFIQQLLVLCPKF
jgi:hypothetical protein